MKLRSKSANRSESKDNTPQVNQTLLPVGVGHVSCSGSSISGCSRVSSVSHRARADLLLAELKEKQVVEQLELDKQRKLLQVRNETEMAKLRLALAEEEENLVNRDEVKGGVMVSEHLSRYLGDCHVQNDAPQKTSLVPVVKPAVDYRLDLLRVELESFAGCSSTYWRFVKQLEYYVEGRVRDDGQSLLYLMHYCKGQARDAIAECVMLPPTLTSNRARETLKDLYGQDHVVARSLIDGLLQGLKPLVEDSDALTKLSLKMLNCEVALTQMNCMSDLNSLQTMERITRVLPTRLQDLWARTVDDILGRGVEPRFQDLQHLVSREARIARSRFGKLAANSKAQGYSRSSSWRNYAQNPRPEATRFTPNQGSTLLVAANRCSVCNGIHTLEECQRFLSRDIPGRWALIKEIKACFSCLKCGHLSSNCSVSKPSSTSGCL